MAPSTLPIIAIVGRPNVGKSTLFNRFAGRRRALVQGDPGITRDRIAEEIDVEGRRILLVDTAGLEFAAERGLPAAVQAQARTALEEADAILFVVDGRAGRLPEDEALARTLHRTTQPVALLANKLDTLKHDAELTDFLSLGFEHSFAGSAEHGRGVWDALEALVDALPETADEPSRGRRASASHWWGGRTSARARCSTGSPARTAWWCPSFRERLETRSTPACSTGDVPTPWSTPLACGVRAGGTGPPSAAARS